MRAMGSLDKTLWSGVAQRAWLNSDERRCPHRSPLKEPAGSWSVTSF